MKSLIIGLMLLSLVGCYDEPKFCIIKPSSDAGDEASVLRAKLKDLTAILVTHKNALCFREFKGEDSYEYYRIDNNSSEYRGTPYIIYVRTEMKEINSMKTTYSWQEHSYKGVDNLLTGAKMINCSDVPR